MRLPAGVRASVAIKDRTSGASAVEWPLRCLRRAAHAGARQFAVNVAAHGVADRLDVVRDFRFAAFAQACGVGGQCRQRRLQAMGQIGGAAARTLDLLFLGVEQGIDFFDQRAHFGRHGGRQMLTAAGPDLGDATAQSVESGRKPSPT